MTAASDTNDGNIAAFIRQFPATTPAKEIVERGAQAGLRFSHAYVYKIRSLDRDHARRTSTNAPVPSEAGAAESPKRRSADRARGGRKTAGRARKRVGKSKAAKSSWNAQHLEAAEQRFIDLVLELGLGRAEELLERIRERVAELLG